MREKLRALGAWLYTWATVIAGVVVGGLSCAFEAISALDGIDLTPVLPPAYALKITTGVAIAKGLHAWVASRRAAGEA